MKLRYRVVAVVALAAILMTMMASLWAKAAVVTPDANNGSIISIRKGSLATKLAKDSRYEVKFSFTAQFAANLPTTDIGDFLVNPASTNARGFYVDSGAFDIDWSNKDDKDKVSLVMEITRIKDDVASITATIKNLRCNRANNKSFNISIWDNYVTKSGAAFPKTEVVASLSEYFADTTTSSSKETSNDPSTPPVSDIEVENIIFYDSSDKRIDTVTEDSPAFSVEIVYSDVGLRKAYINDMDLKGSELQVYIEPTGFTATNSNKGTVKYVGIVDEYPRFRATFRGIKFDGKDNKFSFRVRYIITGDDGEEYDLKGAGSTTAYHARLIKDDESSKDEIPPATPYIIVSKYSFGENDIEAGSEFDLNITYKNTSADTPLENIIMTVITPEDLTVASESNTVYVPFLGAGASLSHKIALRAKPNAKVGSHSVKIEFSYQYLTTKERKDNKTSEEIAVPVTQIDRFSVDPITELTDQIQVGEMGIVTVSFINRGKSTTYNISGVVAGGPNFTGQSVHFGNLETGKSDNLDISVTPTEPGLINGEVVIQYEDESNNVKEVRQPFSITVMEPYIPPTDFFPGGEVDFGPPPRPWWSTTMIVLGSVAAAVPIGAYVTKRVRQKGSEEFDEDF